MSKTITQRNRSKLTGDSAKARNLRKRHNQLLAGKRPVRTRAQRRRCVANHKKSQESA